MELLGKLGIDLKLLLAQIINFLVLLWLLRLVLYKPLVKKLEERTKKAKEIEDGLRDLQRRKEEMKKKEEEMIRETKEKTRRIIAESKEISEEERERILERAEEEMREILKKAREKAELEVEMIRKREEEELLEKAKEILQRVLSKSFTKDLHRKYIDKTIEKLYQLDFSDLKGKEITSVVVVSAYPLNKKEEKQISDFLFKKLRNPTFQEKIDPDLIAGIKVIIDEISIDGSLSGKIKKAIQ